MTLDFHAYRHLPFELKQGIAMILLELRLAPEHQVKPEHRLRIYQLLWPSISLTGDYYELFTKNQVPLSTEHRRYGYLGIITARQVLPIWDQNVKPDFEDPFRKMLALAEGILKGTEDPREVNGFYLQDFYYLMDSKAYETKYSAWSALGAAYSALGMALGAPPFYNALDLNTNQYALLDHDAARDAVVAYSVIDNSEVGDWLEKHFIRREKWDFDLNKRLEFWTWWLTEAIPAAWEAAEQPEAE